MYLRSIFYWFSWAAALGFKLYLCLPRAATLDLTISSGEAKRFGNRLAYLGAGLASIAASAAYVLGQSHWFSSLSRGPVYSNFYILVREEIGSGRSAEEVRTRFLSIIEGSGEVSADLREALEDALAGSPPKYGGRIEA